MLVADFDEQLLAIEVLKEFSRQVYQTFYGLMTRAPDPIAFDAYLILEDNVAITAIKEVSRHRTSSPSECCFGPLMQVGGVKISGSDEPGPINSMKSGALGKYKAVASQLLKHSVHVDS